MIKLILSDLDETLLDDDGTINSQNVTAVQKFVKMAAILFLILGVLISLFWYIKGSRLKQAKQTVRGFIQRWCNRGNP